MSIERRAVQEEVVVSVYRCDHCDAEIPSTTGYAAGKRCQANEVSCWKYDVAGHAVRGSNFDIYNPPLLCDECVPKLRKWLYAAGNGAA